MDYLKNAKKTSKGIWRKRSIGADKGMLSSIFKERKSHLKKPSKNKGILNRLK